MQTSLRRRLLLSLFFLVPLGLGTKFYAGPAATWVRGHAGGVLYVTVWTVAVVVLIPTLSPLKAAAGMLFVTCGLEFLQLWAPPILQKVRQTFVGHALLGSTFGWGDLPHYAIGAVLGTLLVRGVARTVPNERK